MKKDLEKLFKEIVSDKTSGASLIAEKIFNLFEIASSEFGSLTELRKFASKFSRAIRRNHPLLFQLHKVSDIISNGLWRLKNLDEAKIFIVEERKKFYEASLKLSKNFSVWCANEFSRKKIRIATISYSGSVFNAVREALRYISEIYVFRSCPGCEGEIMAQRLGELGANVKLVDDFAIEPICEKVDAIVSGCDAIFADSKILNKVGTSILFRTAKNFRKRTLLLCDSYKIGFVKPKKIENYLCESEKANGFVRVKFNFEIFSPTSVDFFITDIGIFKKQIRALR